MTLRYINSWLTLTSAYRIDGRGLLRQPSPGVSTTASPWPLGTNAKRCAVGNLLNLEGRSQFVLPRPVTMRNELGNSFTVVNRSHHSEFGYHLLIFLFTMYRCFFLVWMQLSRYQIYQRNQSVTHCTTNVATVYHLLICSVYYEPFRHLSL